jgi:hypothetical protein
LGRFVSADTIVPGAANPQSLNRYAYVYNNPLRFSDPTGHIPIVDYDPEKNQYTARLTIQIYGPGASDALAVQYQNDLNRAWNKDNPTFNGSSVVFEVEVFYLDLTGLSGRPAEGRDPPPLGTEGIEASNLIYIDAGNSNPTMRICPYIEPSRSTGRSYDWGVFYANDHSGIILHESAHLYGIYVDRYVSGGHPRDPQRHHDYLTANASGWPGKPAPGEIEEIIALAYKRNQVYHLQPCGVTSGTCRTDPPSRTNTAKTCPQSPQ